jgi:anti-sigma factor RsiW
MSSDALYAQRLLDGELNAGEASAIERSLRDRPDLAAEHQALSGLHRAMTAAARPIDPERHHALLARITERLPDHRPAAYASLRPADILYTTMVLISIGLGYGLVGTFLHQSLIVVAFAVVSVVVGCLMIVLASMLRRAESGILSQLLRKPVVIGPADALVYRATGLGLAVGGIWLTY